MEQLRERALGDGWRKLVVDGVTATPVDVRRGPAVKVVDGPRTETVPREAWPDRLDALLDGARNVHLLAPDGDVHARRTKKGAWLVSSGKPSSTAAPSREHDRARRHPLPADHPLFRETKISRDKERQVQHYVELLRPLPLWEHDRIRVVDAGCGKAYMSLALVAYGRERGTRVELVGLDSNAAVIETVRGVAERLGYDEAQLRGDRRSSTTRATSRSTCSCRYTPATPRRTRRSLPGCDSVQTRSSSLRAAITSSPRRSQPATRMRSSGTACCSAGRPTSSPMPCGLPHSRWSDTAST